MIIQTKWAIRRISDNYYIPQPMGRNGRGGSHAEPINPIEDWANVRLFHTKQAAKIALNAWLKGEWVTKRTPGDYFGGIEPDEETTIRPKGGRDPEDMEVVEVQISLPGEAKPSYILTDAVFMGDGVLFGKAHKDHPKYKEGGDQVIKVSEIVKRINESTFMTKNSIYHVDFVSGGEKTIPAKWTYFDHAGTLRNADGTRSVFDDLDD